MLRMTSIKHKMFVLFETCFDPVYVISDNLIT